MCCPFNCNQNVRYIRGPMGPVGPQGARGPIGPQGPVGPQGIPGVSGTNNAVYTRSGPQTVASGAVIPLALYSATTGSTFTVTNNNLNLPQAGSYLVSYAVNGSVPTGSLAVSLYLNGAPYNDEVITDTAGAGEEVSGEKTILVNTTAPASLSLYNTSGAIETLTDASITAVRLV